MEPVRRIVREKANYFEAVCEEIFPEEKVIIWTDRNTCMAIVLCELSPLTGDCANTPEMSSDADCCCMLSA